jgi:hypothetical protein
MDGKNRSDTNVKNVVGAWRTSSVAEVREREKQRNGVNSNRTSVGVEPTSPLDPKPINGQDLAHSGRMEVYHWIELRTMVLLRKYTT